MASMYAVYGDEASSRAYDRIFQEFQDCLKQRNRLASFQRLTKRQRRDLDELKTILPALAEKLAEIHLHMANGLSP